MHWPKGSNNKMYLLKKKIVNPLFQREKFILEGKDAKFVCDPHEMPMKCFPYTLYLIIINFIRLKSNIKL